MQEQASINRSTTIEAPSGLRERQKQARYERILASARTLFNSLGFDDTKIAAIAEKAEVSTPTVFNYFKTKDQLLLALVLQVHHETQEWVHNFKPKPKSDLADSISEFLATYTRTSIKSINRQTWRYVESTSIRLPDSDFVKRYYSLTNEMFSDFYEFLLRTAKNTNLASGENFETVARIIFNHWSALFVELVRDEAISFDDHAKQLHQDIRVLTSMMKSFS